VYEDPSLIDAFSNSAYCGNHLALFNQYFEFSSSQGYKELEALCRNKDAFDFVAPRVDSLTHFDASNLERFNLSNSKEIVLKAETLINEMEKSRFNKDSIKPFYLDIFEPFQGKLDLLNDSSKFEKFVSDFVQHALFLFYKENYRSSLEISNVLFGAGSKLKDLKGNPLSEKLGSTDLHSELARLADKKLDDAKGHLRSAHLLSDDLKKELLDSLFKRFSKHKPQAKESDPQNLSKSNESDPQKTSTLDKKSSTNNGQNQPDNNYMKYAAVLIVVVLLIAIGLAIFFIMRRKSINA
jgi:hypothetical protein